MSRLHIIFDAGHGCNTPGKRSPVWADGKQLLEWEFNRDIVKRTCNILDKKGVSYDIISYEREDISLTTRANRANAIATRKGTRNCLLVSVHANAGCGTGWEVWTSRGRTLSDIYADIFFDVATDKLSEFKMRADTTDGDNDKEESFAILRKSTCPAILTENLFMDTERDCRFLLSEEGRERIAELHAEAILKCIEWHNENM